MDHVIPTPRQVSLPVDGQTGRFPVRRIYCMGRNDALHAEEMGHDPRMPPFVFMKPTDAVVADGGEFPYPSATSQCHHEVEMVVAIGKRGANVPVENALEFVYGYACGIDFTRRDIQLKLKQNRRPWEEGKSFDCSAPIGAIHRAEDIGHPTKAIVSLEVNGEQRQHGDISELKWGPAKIVSHLSALFELFPGDLIFIGTPPGVNLIKPGDVLKGSVEGVGTCTTRVVESRNGNESNWYGAGELGDEGTVGKSH